MSKFLPTAGTLTQYFDTPVNYFKDRKTHQGLDIVTGLFSKPIYARGSGFVMRVIDKYGFYPIEGFGNEVWIRYDNGTVGRYAHMKKGIDLEVGQSVEVGDIIGYTGATGYRSSRIYGPFIKHLHYEEYENDKRVDPLTSKVQKDMEQIAKRLTDIEQRVFVDHENSLSVLHEWKNKVAVPSFEELYKKLKLKWGKKAVNKQIKKKVKKSSLKMKK